MDRQARRQARSFLEGTWSGTLTIERPGEPSSTGQVTWTFQTVDGTNLQSFRVTIRSQHAWLPITTTVTSAITPSNQPPARISTQGEYPSPQGMHGHVAQRRQCRDPDDRGGLLRRRLLVAAELHVHRTRDVDQDGVNGDGVCRSGGADSVPAHGLRRSRLDRRVPQDVSDREMSRSG